MEKTSNHYILILCGGSGPRLWPLSRASHPKQFLSLVSPNSLIEDTYQRFLHFVPKNNIYFVSHKKYLTQLKQIFGKSVSSANFISEPEKKNTAAAILLGTMRIKKINPNAVITSAPSDHFISPVDDFAKDLKKSYEIASSSESIVTIGIKPTFANPGFGYILPLSKLQTYFPVGKFIEKPPVSDAEVYIKKGALWNSGIYTFSITTILGEFEKYQPSYLKLEYKLLPNLSIDSAISEKSDKLVVIPTHFKWSDIGEWYAIWQQLTKNKDGMAIIDQKTQYVTHNSKNCLISAGNKKLIGLVGLNNLAIIDTPDSLLVCNLNDSFSVRDLITKIVSSSKLKKYFLSNNV